MTSERDSEPGIAPPVAAIPGVAAPRRGPVFGRRYAVAADHPLASLTAMDVLHSGGNAVDATIAAAAVNCVTKPNRTQLGGDAFALVWDRHTGAVECLNAGGRAPGRATRELFPEGIPGRGPRASTVPGIVDSWVELQGRHGSRPLPELLAPAIGFAEDGFPASLHLSAAMPLLREGDAELRRLFWKSGEIPYAAGEVLRQPELADTLRRTGAEGRVGFYSGRTALAIENAMRATGGLLDRDDLSKPTAHWHEPLVSSYRGCTVYEQALPSQGLILLQALNVADRFPIGEWGFLQPDSVHVMVEATRLAFEDVRKYGADPEFETVDVDWLLSPEHAADLARRIDLRRASAAGGVPISSDTTSFVVADPEMAVCYIQSVFAVWGSRFAIPGTGIVMNNRMTGFHLDPASPNRLEPNKRTIHTLNNFLCVRDGELVLGGGTPGADFQVQTNLQVISAVIDHGFDLATAVDSPRWATQSGGRLNLESRIGDDVAAELARRGHVIQNAGAWGVRACSQVIASLAGGGWAMASDLRGEGLALGL